MAKINERGRGRKAPVSPNHYWPEDVRSRGRKAPVPEFVFPAMYAEDVVTSLRRLVRRLGDRINQGDKFELRVYREFADAVFDELDDAAAAIRAKGATKESCLAIYKEVRKTVACLLGKWRAKRKRAKEILIRENPDLASRPYAIINGVIYTTLTSEEWEAALAEESEVIAEKKAKPSKSVEPPTKPTKPKLVKGQDFDVDPPPPNGGDDDDDGGPSKIWLAPHDFWSALATEKIRQGIVPDSIWNIASEYSQRTGYDLDTLIMTMLTAVSGALPTGIRVSAYMQDDIKFIQVPRIWQAIVGPAGTNKTGLLDNVFESIQQLEDKLLQEHKQAMASYRDLSKDEKKDTDPPVRHRVLLAKDNSLEGAQKNFAANEQGLTNRQDELIVFFGNVGRYSNRDGSGEQSARGFWLSVYDSEPFSLTRASREDIDCTPSGVVIGGIQNEVIKKLVTEATRADGLVQRFQPVMMPQQTAKPVKIDNPKYPFTQFHQLIKNLFHSMPLRLTGATLQFSEKAEGVRDAMFDWVAEHMAKHQGPNPQLASHIAKYKGLFLRYCGIFHMIQHWGDKHARSISIETASMVYKFLTSSRYAHAKAFYHMLRKNAEDDDMRNIAEFILSHSLTRVTAREIQNGSSRFDRLTSRDIANTASQMVALGWLQHITGKRADQHKWKVNPDVHTVFEGQAGLVRERNAEAVANIENGKAIAWAKIDAARAAKNDEDNRE